MNQPLTFERPLMTVDLAIFGIRENALHVLAVKRSTEKGEPYPDQWALPGGFVNVKMDEDLEACALRKLKEKTGVVAPYLEQVGSWGSDHRDPRGWSVFAGQIPAVDTRRQLTLDIRERGLGRDLSPGQLTTGAAHDPSIASGAARPRNLRRSGASGAP